MRRPLVDIQIFKERRQRLGKVLEGSALVIPAHPEFLRNHDVHHPYRADSNFYYLTGFEEPEAVFVFRPGHTPETVMFVRPRDPLKETWNGFRFGPEGVMAHFAIDQAYNGDELKERLPKLLAPFDAVYYQMFSNHEMDEVMAQVMMDVRLSQGRSGRGHMGILDPHEILGEMRLMKSAYEVSCLRKAAMITAEGHKRAMEFTHPGVNERQVHATLLYHFMLGGAAREGYGSIVASGANATTLHYVFNDQICHDGDLLLIDAGAEYQYYTADLTRTFPVNKKFTPAQRDVYQRVLQCQKALIEMVRPGLKFKELQERAIVLLVGAMQDLKLLVGSQDEIIEKLLFKKYYPHGVSHWLGLDVHDIGLYKIDGESRPLQSGLVFTVEPGLYIPKDDESAPKELRGIGIRIEDNILVTDIGYDNLTAGAPKEVAEIER